MHFLQCDVVGLQTSNSNLRKARVNELTEAKKFWEDARREISSLKRGRGNTADEPNSEVEGPSKLRKLTHTDVPDVPIVVEGGEMCLTTGSVKIFISRITFVK